MVHHHHVARVHKKKSKEPLDFIVYFFTVATPMFEVPQAVAIYSAKSAENVSIFTWMFFLVADVVWLTYALRRKIRPLVVMYIIYMIVEASIVAGIVIYS